MPNGVKNEKKSKKQKRKKKLVRVGRTGRETVVIFFEICYNIMRIVVGFSDLRNFAV